MDHLSPEYVTAAKILLVSSAICFGVAAAKLRYPSVEAQIRRGDCPDCKTRKSLRTTPINRQSVMFTCGNCVSQWLVESPDKDMVIYGPADQPVMPPLRMTQHEDGTLVFQTDVGIAMFQLHNVEHSTRWGIQSCETPRHKLGYLYRSGVAPYKVDLIPDQQAMAIVSECTPYQWFAASAGVDIYHLMPGWLDGLHGTTEKHDE